MSTPTGTQLSLDRLPVQLTQYAECMWTRSRRSIGMNTTVGSSFFAVLAAMTNSSRIRPSILVHQVQNDPQSRMGPRQ